EVARDPRTPAPRGTEAARWRTGPEVLRQTASPPFPRRPARGVFLACYAKPPVRYTFYSPLYEPEGTWRSVAAVRCRLRRPLVAHGLCVRIFAALASASRDSGRTQERDHRTDRPNFPQA